MNHSLFWPFRINFLLVYDIPETTFFRLLCIRNGIRHLGETEPFTILLKIYLTFRLGEMLEEKSIGSRDRVVPDGKLALVDNGTCQKSKFGTPSPRPEVTMPIFRGLSLSATDLWHVAKVI
ncbi:hypothetical protein GWI33_016390 [Rhynchophorus ferrugineus]|uniref:Uncharacterized protein n=1 Tax=Rhynchophorus ferrugineus TaxID=354439 RepID=A0A834HYV2_RHYFE|nr:hypothetical protein GWI33_016390 [Rhynchophorus ferrugineus]